MTSDFSLPTRRSLLSRLRDLGDRDSWQTFFELYWRLLYNVARRAGLDDADAQDAVQDTIMAVAREIPDFRYDPARGSFKQWLFCIVRRRVADQLRRTYRQRAHEGEDAQQVEDAAAIAEDGVPAMEAAWEEEWERSVLDAAMAHVRAQSNPKHFQVFDYCVLKEWPASKVAETLGMNVAQVYLAKHRVSQAVKRAARRINSHRVQGRPD